MKQKAKLDRVMRVSEAEAALLEAIRAWDVLGKGYLEDTIGISIKDQIAHNDMLDKYGIENQSGENKYSVLVEFKNLFSVL